MFYCKSCVIHHTFDKNNTGEKKVTNKIQPANHTIPKYAYYATKNVTAEQYAFNSTGFNHNKSNVYF